MAQWGNTDTTANSVIWGPAAVPTRNRDRANSVNRDALFGNTTADADGTIVGQFGVDVAEAGENAGATAGWNLRVELDNGRVRYEPLVAMKTISGDADSLPPVPVIVITAQPSNAFAVEPDTAVFSVTAGLTVNTNTTLTYQWQRQADGVGAFVDITGATSPTFTTPATSVSDGTANDGDVYRVVVSAGLGAVPVTSAAATLQVEAVPVIVIDSEPQSLSVEEPAPGVFEVEASLTVNANTTLEYQWELASKGDLPFVEVVGATSNAYTTPATTVVDNNGDVYRVIVTAGKGAVPVTSANAVLTVTSS